MIRRIAAAAAAILLPVMLVGCAEGPSENRSTLSREDPAAAERARAQAAEAEERARQAEAAAVGDALQGIERP